MRFVLITALVFALVYGLALLLLGALNRRWWRRAWVRRAFYWTPLAALICGLLWRLGAHHQLNSLVFFGVGGLSALLLCLAGLTVAFLLTGLAHAAERLHDTWRYRASPPPSPERRRFLRAALASVPALTTAGVADGIIASDTPARIPMLPLSFPELPAPLEGLKILHLSDLHIGPYIHLGDLEELLQRATAHRPDLVLVTGDICDDMPVYGDALRLIEGLQSPLGTFASLGNHEHFRGLRQVKDHFAHSTIPLLVNQGVLLLDGALYLSGADDPQWLSDPESYRDLQRFVEESQEQAPSGTFCLLMSHRSQALDYAAPLGVHLILAGHTHGFQMGINGRSLFETWMPERYPWGLYRKGQSQLYTTAGVGHWFPFRLGCPPEAPLFVLQRA